MMRMTTQKGAARRGFLSRAFNLTLMASGLGLLLTVSGGSPDIPSRDDARGEQSVTFSEWRATNDEFPSLKDDGTGSANSVERPRLEPLGQSLRRQFSETINSLGSAESYREFARAQARADILETERASFRDWLKSRNEGALRGFYQGSADVLTRYLTDGAESGALDFGFVRAFDVDLTGSVEDRSWQTGLSALGAVRETNDDAMVWQMRATGQEGALGGNLGFINRRAVGDSLAGANFFLDFEDSSKHDAQFWRGSFGLEYQTRFVDLVANQYVALSDPVKDSFGNIVYTKDGADVNLSFNPLEDFGLAGGFTFYRWDGDFGEADDKGFRFDVGGDLFPSAVQGWKLALNADKPSGAELDLGGNVSYSYNFNAPSPLGRGRGGEDALGFNPRSGFFAPARREYTQRIGVVAPKSLASSSEPAFVVSDVKAVVMAGTVTISYSNGAPSAVTDSPSVTVGVYQSESVMIDATQGIAAMTANDWEATATRGVFHLQSHDGLFNNRINVQSGTLLIDRTGATPALVVADGVTVSLNGTSLEFGVDLSGMARLKVIEGQVDVFVADVANLQLIGVGAGGVSVYTLNADGSASAAYVAGCDSAAERAEAKKQIPGFVGCVGDAYLDFTPDSQAALVAQGVELLITVSAEGLHFAEGSDVAWDSYPFSPDSGEGERASLSVLHGGGSIAAAGAVVAVTQGFRAVFHNNVETDVLYALVQEGSVGEIGDGGDVVNCDSTDSKSEANLRIVPVCAGVVTFSDETPRDISTKGGGSAVAFYAPSGADSFAFDLTPPDGNLTLLNATGVAATVRTIPYSLGVSEHVLSASPSDAIVAKYVSPASITLRVNISGGNLVAKSSSLPPAPASDPLSVIVSIEQDLYKASNTRVYATIQATGGQAPYDFTIVDSDPSFSLTPVAEDSSKAHLLFDGNFNDVMVVNVRIADTTSTITASFSVTIFKSLGVVYEDGDLIVIGGEHDNGAVLNDAWTRPDGSDLAVWVSSTVSIDGGAYDVIRGRAVSFAGRLFILGGTRNGAHSNETWHTSDGQKWEKYNAPWGARSNHGALVFKDALWVFGGEPNSDVWKTEDGFVWEYVPSKFEDFDVSRFAFATIDGNVIVAGWRKGTVVPFSYYTSDMKTWRKWDSYPAGQDSTMVRFGNHVFLTGGRYAQKEWWGLNRIYTNRVSWHDKLGREKGYYDAPYSRRSGAVFVNLDGKVLLIGGNDKDGNYLNEIWSSANPYSADSWTKITGDIPWDPRTSHMAVVHNFNYIPKEQMSEFVPEISTPVTAYPINVEGVVTESRLHGGLVPYTVSLTGDQAGLVTLDWDGGLAFTVRMRPGIVQKATSSFNLILDDSYDATPPSTLTVEVETYLPLTLQATTLTASFMGLAGGDFAVLEASGGEGGYMFTLTGENAEFLDVTHTEGASYATVSVSKDYPNVNGTILITAMVTDANPANPGIGIPLSAEIISVLGYVPLTLKATTLTASFLAMAGGDFAVLEASGGEPGYMFSLSGVNAEFLDVNHTEGSSAATVVLSQDFPNADATLLITAILTDASTLTPDTFSTLVAKIERNYSKGLYGSGEIVIIGGESGGGLTLSDMWYNAPGDSLDSWKALPESDASDVRDAAVVTFAGRIYVIGGERDGEASADVWHSADAETWTKYTAPWPARWGHAGLVFDHALYVFGGGRDGKRAMRDTWRTYDGLNWERVTSHKFGPRVANFASGVINGTVYVAGGRADAGGDRFTSVSWYSTDFTSWTKTPDQPKTIGRQPYYTVSDDKFFVIGGGAFGDEGVEEDGTGRQDIVQWYDGSEWHSYNPPFSPRYRGAMVARGDTLIMLGGRDKGGHSENISEVWSNSDPTNKNAWTRDVETAPWAGRARFGAALFDPREDGYIPSAQVPILYANSNTSKPYARFGTAGTVAVITAGGGIGDYTFGITDTHDGKFSIDVSDDGDSVGLVWVNPVSMSATYVVSVTVDDEYAVGSPQVIVANTVRIASDIAVTKPDVIYQVRGVSFFDVDLNKFEYSGGQPPYRFVTGFNETVTNSGHGYAYWLAKNNSLNVWGVGYKFRSAITVTLEVFDQFEKGTVFEVVVAPRIGGKLEDGVLTVSTPNVDAAGVVATLEMNKSNALGTAGWKLGGIDYSGYSGEIDLITTAFTLVQDSDNPYAAQLHLNAALPGQGYILATIITSDQSPWVKTIYPAITVSSERVVRIDGRIFFSPSHVELNESNGAGINHMIRAEAGVPPYEYSINGGASEYTGNATIDPLTGELAISNDAAGDVLVIEATDSDDESVQFTLRVVAPSQNLYAEGDILVIGGELNATTIVTDMWANAEGTDLNSWELIASDGVSDVRDAAAVAFAGKVFVVGGERDGEASDEVWHSSNGETWEKYDAPWSARWGHAALVYDNSLWVIGGGANGGQAFDDVWKSPDGLTWEEVASDKFTPRVVNFASGVVNGTVYVAGGRRYAGGNDYTSDFWSSTDMTVWVKPANQPATSGRLPYYTVSDGKFFLIGGAAFGEGATGRQDIVQWYDGAKWQSYDPPFSPRYRGALVARNGKLIMLGGRDRGGDADNINEVWSNSNPTNAGSWTLDEAHAAWDGRSRFAAVVFETQSGYVPSAQVPEFRIEVDIEMPIALFGDTGAVAEITAFGGLPDYYFDIDGNDGYPIYIHDSDTNHRSAEVLLFGPLTASVSIPLTIVVNDSYAAGTPAQIVEFTLQAASELLGKSPPTIYAPQGSNSVRIDLSSIEISGGVPPYALEKKIENRADFSIGVEEDMSAVVSGSAFQFNNDIAFTVRVLDSHSQHVDIGVNLSPRRGVTITTASLTTYVYPEQGTGAIATLYADESQSIGGTKWSVIGADGSDYGADIVPTDLFSVDASDSGFRAVVDLDENLDANGDIFVTVQVENYSEWIVAASPQTTLKSHAVVRVSRPAPPSPKTVTLREANGSVLSYLVQPELGYPPYAYSIVAQPQRQSFSAAIGETSGLLEIEGGTAGDAVEVRIADAIGSSAVWNLNIVAADLNLYTEGDIVILGGEHGGGVTLSDMWLNAENESLSSWTLLASTGVSNVRDAGVAAFAGRIFVTGGERGGDASDAVWHSSDTNSWTKYTAPWPARWGHAAIVHDHALWIVGGGATGSPAMTDVWKSLDGFAWTRVAEDKFDPAVVNFASGVLNGTVYVAGGRRDAGGDDFTSDFWHSTDLVTWTKPAAQPETIGRLPYFTVSDGNFFVAGGGAFGKDGDGRQDIVQWFDGSEWKSHNPPFSPRYLGAMVARGDTLIMLGGRDSGGTSNNISEIWSNPNPTNAGSWTRDVETATWEGRGRFAAVVFEQNNGYVPSPQVPVFSAESSANKPYARFGQTGRVDEITATGGIGDYQFSIVSPHNDVFTLAVSEKGNSAELRLLTPISVTSAFSLTISVDDSYEAGTPTETFDLIVQVVSEISVDEPGVIYQRQGALEFDINLSLIALSGGKAPYQFAEGKVVSEGYVVYTSSDGRVVVYGQTNQPFLKTVSFGVDVLDEFGVGASFSVTVEPRPGVMLDSSPLTIKVSSDDSNKSLATLQVNESDALGTPQWEIAGIDFSDYFGAANSIADGINVVAVEGNPYSANLNLGDAAIDGRGHILVTVKTFDSSPWAKTISPSITVTSERVVRLVAGVAFSPSSVILQERNGLDISYTVRAESGTLPYSYSIESSTPAVSVDLDPSSGAVVLKNADAGDMVVVRVTDGADDSVDFTLIVAAPSQNLFSDGDILLIGGEHSGDENVSDMWSNAEGSALTVWSVLSTTGVSDVRGAAVAAFAGRVFVTGGKRDGAASDEVWHSQDASTWTKYSAPWDARWGHAALVHDHALWVFGGGAGTAAAMTDVWKSYDGLTWSEVDSDGFTPAVVEFASGVIDGKVYVAGGRLHAGGVNDFTSDFWHSADLVNWTKPDEQPKTIGRAPYYTVSDGNFFVIGGAEFGDGGTGRQQRVQWYDGSQWQDYTPSFSARYYGSMVSRDGTLIMLGGRDKGGNATNLGEIWSSSNPTESGSWTLVSQTSDWAGRANFAAVLFEQNNGYIPSPQVPEFTPVSSTDTPYILFGDTGQVVSFTASGGVAPYSFQITPTPPTPLFLHQPSGNAHIRELLLPKAVTVSMAFPFTVAVDDSYASGTPTREFVFTVLVVSEMDAISPEGIYVEKGAQSVRLDLSMVQIGGGEPPYRFKERVVSRDDYSIFVHEDQSVEIWGEGYEFGSDVTFTVEAVDSYSQSVEFEVTVSAKDGASIAQGDMTVYVHPDDGSIALATLEANLAQAIGSPRWIVSGIDASGYDEEGIGSALFTLTGDFSSMATIALSAPLTAHGDILVTVRLIDDSVWVVDALPEPTSEVVIRVSRPAPPAFNSVDLMESNGATLTYQVKGQLGYPPLSYSIEEKPLRSSFGASIDANSGLLQATGASAGDEIIVQIKDALGYTGLWTLNIIAPSQNLFSAGEILLIGGEHSRDENVSDMWANAEGSALTVWSVRSTAGVSDVRGAAAVAFAGRIFVTGGKRDGAASDEVWHSQDASTWTKYSAPWDARWGHAALVHDHALWVFGGGAGTAAAMTDVWKSYDGLTWDEVDSDGFTPGVVEFASGVIDGKVYVAGGRLHAGGVNDFTSDFWHSADLVNWTKPADQQPKTIGRAPYYTVSDGKFFVIGGAEFGDGGTGRQQRVQWYDGSKWQDYTPSFSARYYGSMVSRDGTLIMLGGRDKGGKATNLGEIWSSSNPTESGSWTLVSQTSDWSGRANFAALVFEEYEDGGYIPSPQVPDLSLKSSTNQPFVRFGQTGAIAELTASGGIGGGYEFSLSNDYDGVFTLSVSASGDTAELLIVQPRTVWSNYSLKVFVDDGYDASTPAKFIHFGIRVISDVTATPPTIYIKEGTESADINLKDLQIIGGYPPYRFAEKTIYGEGYSVMVNENLSADLSGDTDYRFNEPVSFEIEYGDYYSIESKMTINLSPRTGATLTVTALTIAVSQNGAVGPIATLAMDESQALGSPSWEFGVFDYSNYDYNTDMAFPFRITPLNGSYEVSLDLIEGLDSTGEISIPVKATDASSWIGLANPLSQITTTVNIKIVVE